MSSPRPAFSASRTADVQSTPAVLLLSMIVLAILIASAGCWIVAAVRAIVTWGWLPPSLAAGLEDVLRLQGIAPKLPLVAWSPRRPAPWALFDLIALVALWFVANVAVSVAFKK